MHRFASLAMLSIFLALPVMAAQHPVPEKKNYAKNFFIGPSLLYTEKIGGALNGAYQFPKSRVMLMLSATYTYSEDASGTVSRTISCRRQTFPWHHEGEGNLGVGFTAIFPLGK